jgi:hypothetical protein
VFAVPSGQPEALVRTSYRIATTIVALGAVFPFGAVSAHAESGAPLVDQANWFWSRQVGGTIPGTPQPYPGSLPDPTMPQDKNDAAIAGNPAQQEKDPKGVEKETYLSFSLATIPLQSTVSKFTFTLPLDQEEKGNAYDPTAAPVLVACAPKGGWGQGQLGQLGEQFDGKPEDDCAAAPEGKFDATAKAYTFDITDLAQKWVNGDINFGVAIRHAEDYAAPYNLVVGPIDKITAAIEFTPYVAPPTPTTVPTPPPTVPTVAPPVTGTGNTGNGYSGNVSVPTVGTPAPRPQVSPPAPVTQPVQRPVTQVAARPLTQENGLPGGFWFGMLAAVVLIGVVSLVLGDPEVDVATQRERGLDRALRRRAAGAGAPSRGLRPRTV